MNNAFGTEEMSSTLLRTQGDERARSPRIAMNDDAPRSILLSTIEASRLDRSLAAFAAIFSVLMLAIAAPFADMQLPVIPAFMASHQSAVALCSLLTAALLYSQFNIVRSRALLLLASGYLFTALLAICYALVYRDVFSATGLFDANPQTTVWLYVVWHGGFPLIALGYALQKRSGGGATIQRPAREAIPASIAGVVAVVGMLVWTVTGPTDHLPTLIAGANFLGALVYTPTLNLLLAIDLLLCLATLAVLASRRPQSVLDVWLMVVMCAWVCDIALSSILNGARYDLGFYAGRLYGLLAASFVLAVLLVENVALQLQAVRLLETVRRQAHAESIRHQARERLFSAAVESSNDAIITKSLDGAITGWNQAAERLFGYSAGEAIGQKIDIIVPSERRGEVQSILDRVRHGIPVENHETIRIAKNGRVIDISLSVSPIKSETGVVIGTAKVARDITDQKLAEEKFQLAVEASPNGMVMIDGYGRIILINTEVERSFGYRRAELMNQPIEVLVPSPLQASHAKLRRGFEESAARRRMGAGRDLFGRRKDGSEFPIEVALNPIQTRRGLLVLSVIVDISESKRTKEALLESEQLARGIIDTALDGFVQTDAAGKIVDWNRQSEQIFGWSRREAIGRPFLELVLSGNDDTPAAAAFGSYLRTGDAPPSGHRFEVAAQRHDGRAITIEISLTAFQRHGGRVFNVFIRDLTDRRSEESQFRQAQKMEAVGQLTGGIAHDFNNILTVITGTIEILAEAVADRPQMAAIAKLIDDAAARGADLTQRLLAFARKQPLQPVEVDVNFLVVESARLLRPTLGEHIEIDSMLADDASPALVDPSQLTTAIINLSLNARDAMPDGGKLTLETKNVVLDQSYADMNNEVTPGSYVMIAVNDSGQGIMPEVLEKVFEPFFTTKEVGKGSGLGLSMVYGFVKQSNGHVKIYSEVGHGTTVKLYLPRASGLALQPAEADTSTQVVGGSESVLIVEDDALVRTYVIAQVRSLGYVTLSASNAVEALAIIKSDTEIDLLFTDVIMPGSMNGRLLARDAVKLRPKLRVLYTSGYTENAIVHHGRLDAGVLLLAKPYRKADLARMIRLAISG